MIVMQVWHACVSCVYCTQLLLVQMRQWAKVEASAIDVSQKRTRGNAALGISTKDANEVREAKEREWERDRAALGT